MGSSALVGEVTVIVPHYGDHRPTTALVERLKRQADIHLQVVVADDHSPDPFPDMSGVEVVRRDHNGGFGSNVNSAVAHASHDLLLILNSDVDFGDTFVSELVRAAEPWMPAVVSPRTVDRKGRDQWVGRQFPQVRHQTVEWLEPLVRFRPWLHNAVGHDVSAVGKTAVVDWVVGAALLLPTAAFREVGGFDERFFMNSEEVDLQRRLGALGVPSVVLEAPRLIHEGGGSTPSGDRRQWLVDSRLAYARKWGGRSGARRLRSSLVTASCINFVWNTVRAIGGRQTHPVRTLRLELGLLGRGRRPGR
jgi:N-acetylglucosaminyl-diphospho-decaprenol L-rhamnosyltransferase